MHDAFQQRARLGKPFLPEQALAQMRTGVNVLRVKFQRSAITFFGLDQPAALKINIAQLEMVGGVADVIDLRLKFLDAFAALRAGQFKTARGRGRGAIDQKKIQHRRQTKPDENEKRPDPFAVAKGMNQHPDLECRQQQQKRVRKQKTPVFEIGDQRSKHFHRRCYAGQF